MKRDTDVITKSKVFTTQENMQVSSSMFYHT